MGAQLIDGKAFAADLREQIGMEVGKLKAEQGLEPGLAVVLVGEDPASQVYVRNKIRQTQAVGMRSMEHIMPPDASQEALEGLIAKLNQDPEVHGILVQLPLPKHLDSLAVLEAINPDKDVDGLHLMNAGRLFSGIGEPLVPCTPQGSLMLLRHTLGNLSGLNALVIGRSNLFGKPMGQLLLNENATVTIAHSRSRDLAALTRQADVVIAAVGRAEMVRGDWVKPGATVLDVGINRIEDASTGEARLVGDVAFDEVAEVAAHITPVPGGIGPMTIACLLNNTRIAACRQAGIKPLKLAGF